MLAPDLWTTRARLQSHGPQGQVCPAGVERPATKEGGDGVRFPLPGSLLLVESLLQVLPLLLLLLLLLVLAPREVDEDILRVEEAGHDEEFRVEETGEDGGKKEEGEEEENGGDDGAVGEREVESSRRTMWR